MATSTYSLNQLSDTTGIEARTIRSYIERGLLPGAEARGRAATYSDEHLSRLEVIKSLRRARPNMGLSEIRIVLQGLSPAQIHEFARGSITAPARTIGVQPLEEADSQHIVAEDDADIPTVDWERCSAELTGAERLVCLLREVSGFTTTASASKVEAWQRIAITPDIELSVRAEFSANQLATFRELADLLRYLFERADALSKKGVE